MIAKTVEAARMTRGGKEGRRAVTTVGVGNIDIG